MISVFDWGGVVSSHTHYRIERLLPQVLNHSTKGSVALFNLLNFDLQVFVVPSVINTLNMDETKVVFMAD